MCGPQPTSLKTEPIGLWQAMSNSSNTFSLSRRYFSSVSLANQPPFKLAKKMNVEIFQKLTSKSRTTLQLLNAFEDDVNNTCTSVANVNNRFEALSDTQFIENKVRDDSPETEEPSVEVQVRRDLHLKVDAFTRV